MMPDVPCKLQAQRTVNADNADKRGDLSPLSVVRDLVLESPVVKHVRNLIARLDLDFLAELGRELQLTTLRVEEWLIVQHPREDELCPQPVCNRSFKIRQQNSLAIASFKIC